MAWPGTSGNRVQQMVIAKLSLRLSLNNPSNIYNIWHCSKEICHKTTEEERDWASWMPNAIVTAGNRAPQVEFPSSVLPVLWMCTTVFAWFTPSLMDCRVCPIALQCFVSFVHISDKNWNWCNTLLRSLQPIWPWLWTKIPQWTVVFPHVTSPSPVDPQWIPSGSPVLWDAWTPFKPPFKALGGDAIRGVMFLRPWTASGGCFLGVPWGS